MSSELSVTHLLCCLSVAGNWTEWSQWVNCPHGGKTQNTTRHRTCNNPPPENGGANCSGGAQETKPCPSKYVIGELFYLCCIASNQHLAPTVCCVHLVPC